MLAKLFSPSTIVFMVSCAVPDEPVEKPNSASFTSSDSRFNFSTKDTHARKMGSDIVTDADGPGGVSVGIVLRGISTDGSYTVSDDSDAAQVVDVQLRDANFRMLYTATTATEAVVQFNPLRISLKGVKMKPYSGTTEKPFVLDAADGTWNTIK